jgi:hypothetical protein
VNDHASARGSASTIGWLSFDVHDNVTRISRAAIGLGADILKNSQEVDP